MPTHDFKDESTGVAERGRVDVIDSLANALESGWCAYRQVRHGHVIVDGPNQADNFKMRMPSRLALSDPPYISRSD